MTDRSVRVEYVVVVEFESIFLARKKFRKKTIAKAEETVEQIRAEYAFGQLAPYWSNARIRIDRVETRSTTVATEIVLTAEERTGGE